MFQKRIDPFVLDQTRVSIILKNCLDWVNLDLILKSSLLTLDSSGRLIVSVLGREKGYTVKYTPSPVGVPKGKAGGNS